MEKSEIVQKIPLKNLLSATLHYTPYNHFCDIPTYTDVAKKLYLRLEGLKPGVKMVVDKIILNDGFNMAYDLLGCDLWLNLSNTGEDANKLSKSNFAYISKISNTLKGIKRIYRSEGSEKVCLSDDLSRDFDVEDATVSRFRIGLFDMSGVVPKDITTGEMKVLEHLYRNEVNGVKLHNETGEPMSQEETQRLIVERTFNRLGAKKEDVEKLKEDSRLVLYLLTGRDPNNFRGVPEAIITGKGLAKLLEDLVPFFELSISGDSDEKLILYFGESKHLWEPFKRRRAEYKGRTYYKLYNG